MCLINPTEFISLAGQKLNKQIHMKSNLIKFVAICLLSWTIIPLIGQNTSNHGNKFEQLGTVLPDGNVYRTMDGAPGPQYWQQRCDYDISCTLDEENQRLTGEELITYYNNSPNTLKYLWLQLDENQHAADADNLRFDPSSIRDAMDENALRRLELWRETEKYGHNILKVADANDDPLEYMINKTLMRVELPEPLRTGETFTFKVNWYYNIIDRVNTPASARGGYEFFEDDENYLFTITQWFPRLCAYTDYEGWQNKQFTGRGEFALTFGNYVVKMTVPDDHIVGSTGECLNYHEVLTEEEMNRLKQAKKSGEPIEIVTLDEAKKKSKKKSAKGTKTWIYKADNVRDFAWCSSRRFVWDAMIADNYGKDVMCMSYYCNEAYPIYRRYSTKATKHTLDVYSKYSIPYPYPVAISVEGQNGMEYPMICFNPGRAEEDGTYSEQAKNSAITVIIHEVGHNYFPMIINSDERQWTWMDEGLNTFLQFIAEQEWDNNYDSGEGPPHMVAEYMGQPKDRLEPIMTNSENIVGFFQNAYQKTATGLNMLRETIMGRELFDYAFKEYCQRWAFKSPTPADFFRSMEDASGVDLDWFWRGWFYGIENVDISLDSIKWFKVDLENNPEKREYVYKQNIEEPFEHITKKRYKEQDHPFVVDQDKELQDFYTYYEPWNTEDSIFEYKTNLYEEQYSDSEKQQLFGDKNYYQLHFSNKGGLVMPVIIEWTYEDGTTEIERVPVEIWRKNENNFTKVFVKNKVVKGIVIDPYRETADIDESNNNWPVKELPSRFQVFKAHQASPDNMNMMQKAKKRGKIIKP